MFRVRLALVIAQIWLRLFTRSMKMVIPFSFVEILTCLLLIDSELRQRRIGVKSRNTPSHSFIDETHIECIQAKCGEGRTHALESTSSSSSFTTSFPFSPSSHQQKCRASPLILKRACNSSTFCGSKSTLVHVSTLHGKNSNIKALIAQDNRTRTHSITLAPST